MNTAAPPEIFYPESDGEPMADNTRQYDCIVALQGGIDELRPDDFVGADNFWYPVEGRPDIVTAPDVYVAIGRPKGHRPSYQQWKEGDVAPQVTFEVLSPRNRADDLRRKLEFYQDHGVEEYYIYDPDRSLWKGYHRVGERLDPIPDMGTWTSPLLKIRFDTASEEMRVLRPDGEPFHTYLEMAALRRAEEAKRKAEEAKRKAEEAKRKAEEAKRMDAEARAQTAELRVQELMARLRAAGIDPTETGVGLP